MITELLEVDNKTITTKKFDSVNKTNSSNTVNSKSEEPAPSLFDSLLKEAKGTSKNDTTSSEETKQKTTTTNVKEEKVQNLDNSKKSTKNITKDPTKDIAEKLVDIVVSKAKSDKSEEVIEKTSEEIESKKKSDKSDTKEKISIKDSMINRKTTTSNLKEEKSDSKIDKSEQKADAKIEKEEIKSDSKIDKSEQKIEVNIEKAEIKTDNKIDKSEQKIEVNVEKAEIKSDSKTEQKAELSDKKEIVQSDVAKTALNINNIVDDIVDNRIDLEENKKSDISKISVSAADSKSSELLKTPLMASMFLSAQKNLKELASKEQITNAKKNLEENKTVNGVKKSAQMLDLNLEDAQMKVDKSKPKVNAKETSKPFTTNSNSMLNKMFMQSQISQGLAKENIVNSQIQEKIISTNTLETTKEKEVVVNMTAPTQVVETIQNKIIGAQQKVSGFMSDVARSMYLNYKPPVNTFKINLNPANLGSISIIMRSNKVDNSISVSMNMSNSSTMEVFSDNKSSLQSALVRNFNDGSNVNLSFNMQGDNSDNGFEQFNQNNNNQQNNEQSDSNVVSQDNEDEEVSENNDYM